MVHTQPAPVAAQSAFAALGLSRDIVVALAAQGIIEPFPVQALTIPDALAGRDICGKARTGSGKTLAFGLPLVERISGSAARRPRALVLVPTRELASQVVRELAGPAAGRRVRIAAVYGGASLMRQADRLRAGVDIVVATPGRLIDLLDRGALVLGDIETVVIDEADQMADLGFMPQVERILDQVEGRHQTLLFSATLDGAIDRLIRKYQHDPVHHEVASSDEEEMAISHRFVGVEEGTRLATAAAIAAGPERTLIFARTQRGVERLARQLANEGVGAGAIHGGLSQPQRERALRAFTTGERRVLVATNVAARGIHVDGVDIVVHYDPPEDAKTYLHRSGRTARAGAAGVVVTLVSPEQRRDVALLRRDAGVHEAVVDMGPDDPRLADLAAWQPPIEEPARPQERALLPAGGGAFRAPEHRRRSGPRPQRPAARERDGQQGEQRSQGFRGRGGFDRPAGPRRG